MKKLLLICGIILLFALSLPAQTIDYVTEYEDGFQAFAEEIAASLPFNATLGLSWSDAYIGQFPHFGVGLTVGATSIPFDIMEPVFNMLPGYSLPSNLDFIEQWGAPLPAWSLDARLGGFILPFDVGVKFGFLPDEAKVLMPFEMDYMLVGGDVRLALLKGKGAAPDLSIGLGYTYLDGAVYLADVVGGDQDIVLPIASYVLRVTDPDVTFNWQANVIDLKAQVSKKLAIITPFLGAGVSWGGSKAGGGLSSDVQLSTDGGSTFNSINQTQIDTILAAVEGLDLTSTSVEVGAQSVDGWAVRAFGGIGFNLWLLKIDLSGMYNFTSSSYGVALNTRIQW
jgi:hypothetical protein